MLFFDAKIHSLGVLFKIAFHTFTKIMRLIYVNMYSFYSISRMTHLANLVGFSSSALTSLERVIGGAYERISSSQGKSCSEILHSPNSMNRDHRRSSIHDITSANGADASPPQGTITSQAIANSVAFGSPMKHPPQANMARVIMYGPPVGTPITSHMVSVVGTPVMPPPSQPPYVMPVAYPTPHPSMRQ